MPSLDGYSLNEKMDKKFEDIEEKIEVLKFRLDEEVNDLHDKIT
jgi:hypothetical protein